MFKTTWLWSTKVQSSFQINKEVSLGSCREIETLSKVKHPNSTSPRLLSESVSSNLCSTNFTNNFFVAFEGTQLSISSIRVVSEVNVKFLGAWLKPRKRNNGKKCSNFHTLLYIRNGMSEKRKTNHKRSSQLVYFFLITDHKYLRTSYMDESACLWNQLKWNKFPFYGVRLSGKFTHGD